MKKIKTICFADYEKINAFKTIELKIVNCPFYDGLNSKFNENEAVINFKKEYGKYPINKWLSADYNKVKGWASKEPTKTKKFLIDIKK